MTLLVSEMEKTEDERFTVATLAEIRAVPAQSFTHFEGEDDDIDIENKPWVTSIAHGGGGIDEEDAVSALLSLAGWVNVVEEDVD